MTQLLHELPLRAAERLPDAAALVFKTASTSYAELVRQMGRFTSVVRALGIDRQERVAVFLPKQPETVVAMFGAAQAGCVFVPVNPILKPAQVAYILKNCNVRVLVTSAERARELTDELNHCPDLRHLVLVGSAAFEGTLD